MSNVRIHHLGESAIDAELANAGGDPSGDNGLARPGERGVRGDPAVQDEVLAELGEAAATIWIREALVCTGRLGGVDYLAPARRVFVKAKRV